jgi:hypothetical protein
MNLCARIITELKTLSGYRPVPNLDHRSHFGSVMDHGQQDHGHVLTMRQGPQNSQPQHSQHAHPMNLH